MILRAEDDWRSRPRAGTTARTWGVRAIPLARLEQPDPGQATAEGVIDDVGHVGVKIAQTVLWNAQSQGAAAPAGRLGRRPATTASTAITSAIDVAITPTLSRVQEIDRSPSSGTGYGSAGTRRCCSTQRGSSSTRRCRCRGRTSRHRPRQRPRSLRSTRRSPGVMRVPYDFGVRAGQRSIQHSRPVRCRQ